MVIDLLRFMAWNALVILRLPLRTAFIVMACISLFMAITGVVALPFGGVGGEPLWAQLAAIFALSVCFSIWAGLAYLYDSLIFRLTPKDREIILSE